VSQSPEPEVLIQKRSFIAKWGILMTYVSVLIVAVFLFAYVNHAIAENNRKMCGLVTTLDGSYREVPPGTPTGIKVADEIHGLRLSYDC
jgi:hypothetical protein